MLPLLLLQYTAALQDPGGEWIEVQRVLGTQPVGRLGWSAALVGDTNLDGCADYVLGASYQKNSQGTLLAGSVYFVDGATGQFQREHQGTDADGQFGWIVCRVGDVNFDGIPEYGASSGGADPGQIGAQVFDGGSGTLLFQIPVPANSRAYGQSMDGVGDWNGDGRADFAVGDYFNDVNGMQQAGTVYVYSGADAGLLLRLDGEVAGHQFGKGLRGGGDANGDGIQDLLVWSWRSAGHVVHVLAGGVGAEVYRLTTLTGNGYFGSGLDFLEDLDADGCDEILVGAPEAGAFSQGEAYLFSGRSGALVHRWHGETDQLARFGESISSLGDWDKDGVDDLAVGSPHNDPNTGQGKVFFYSGEDGRLLHTVTTWEENSRLGETLDGGMDVNGDGLNDALLPSDAAEAHDIFWAGAVYVFSFDPYLDASDRLISASSGGTIAFALDFPVTEAGLDYRLLASTNVLGNQGPGTKPWMTLSGVTIPLVETALTHRMFNRPPAVFAGAQGTLDANGSAAVTLTLPPGSAASEVGRTFRFAAVSIQANGHASASSAAVLLTIEP